MSKLQEIKPDVMKVIKAVQNQYGPQRVCRAMLSAFVHELGGMPALVRLASCFTDKTMYKDRPMLTICKHPVSVYMLGWREGQGTEIHDHSKSEVGIIVLQGRITEDVFFAMPSWHKAPDRTCVGAMSRQARAGDAWTCPTNYIHRMTNLHPECAVTLHAYGPVLTDMSLYEELGDRLEFKGHWHEDAAEAPH